MNDAKQDEPQITSLFQDDKQIMKFKQIRRFFAAHRLLSDAEDNEKKFHEFIERSASDIEGIKKQKLIQQQMKDEE